jgi:hypothetical protein
MSKKNQIQIRFEDRPELSETFADSLQSIDFDGQAMRIVLCTTRYDAPKSSETPTAARIPSCRLVLTPNAALKLYNKLRQIVSALEKAGAVTTTQTPPQTVQ